jgi:hypothetical protein
MSGEFGIEFATPDGERLYFAWKPDGGEPPPWRLDGELDWDEIELIRVLSAGFEDGRVLGLVAVRPAGAEGHGEEFVAAALVNEGQASAIDESLLSVEYDGSGLPRRVGLELYRTEGGIPLRVAGEVTAADREPEGALERTTATLSLRLTGSSGAGRLDIVRPA